MSKTDQQLVTQLRELESWIRRQRSIDPEQKTPTTPTLPETRMSGL